MRIAFTVIALLGNLCIQNSGFSAEIQYGWPAISREHKPWTYWWWMGSAVDRKNLTANLEDYSRTGLGGVHIIPIYGVKGFEDRFIPYLSADWMNMLELTVREANRLGLGVDMTLGTGWPYGGPSVTPECAAKKAVVKSVSLAGGDTFRYKRENAVPVMITAVSKTGRKIPLLPDAAGSDARISWTAPSGDWKIYVVEISGTGQKVKRAAPGGEGYVLDFFSRRAFASYCAGFDMAFAERPKGMIRAFYNDSYEVYGANWTDDVPEEFQKRYGYNLLEHIPLLVDNADSDSAARIRHDYNECVSALLLERFTESWVGWSHDKGSLTRNQAHGSPGNLIDLYAAADIPETEAFGPSGFSIPGLRVDENYPEQSGKPDILMHKFASSAAHLAGRNLVSSESCTWLGEHFQVSLSQIKPEIDALFAGGVNHIFFHGIAYSPREAAFPGWLFYASTNFGQSGSFWRDVPSLTSYIARSQAFLQKGEPANDLLLYWTIHDTWRKKADEDMLHHFQVHNVDQWFYGTRFHMAAEYMTRKGYTFDYISDKFIKRLMVDNGMLRSEKGKYTAILIPGSRYMPLETLKKLLALAEQGGRILFVGSFPADVPGLADYTRKHAEFRDAAERLLNGGGSGRMPYGKGEILCGEDLGAVLPYAGVKPESLAEFGLTFVRRKDSRRYHYFVANLGRNPVEAWVPLAVDVHNAALYDPVSGVYGMAAVRKSEDGSAAVFVQMQPGESRILETNAPAAIDMKPWFHYTPAGEPVRLGGRWNVRFIEGGPDIPESYSTTVLESWTERGGNAEHFHGTAAYTLNFPKPDCDCAAWFLNLGEIRESARICLNDNPAGVLWCHPFRLIFQDNIFKEQNELVIEVANLASNRIRYMDRLKIPWKTFYDINYVDIRYKPFDASGWNSMDSGLLGPVTLTPLKVMELR